MYVAWKRWLHRKFAPFVLFLSCSVSLKSILLISCVFWIFFSERWQSTLFQKIQSGFKITFSKNYGRMPRSSRLLNCFWIHCGSFQAIKIFSKALATVSMITMFWFQFLRHMVELIFHSIWWVGRFHRSPFADILKRFQSILRSFATRKVYKWFTSWTLGVNYTHQGFLLFFWSSNLCLLLRHVFRLFRSTLSNHL